MAETATFDPPILADPGADTFRMASLTLQVYPEPIVKVMLQQWANGFISSAKRVPVIYRGADAQRFLQDMNVANFSAGTNMRHWVMERLEADGKLAHGVLV
jgi:hypothetical protein